MGFILGRKIEMSQRFKDGKLIPVTLIKVEPCFVTRIKTEKKDGYNAIQIGCGIKKSKKKSVIGQFKILREKNILKDNEIFSYLKEFRVSKKELKKFKIGDKLEVSIFKPNQKVKISGLSKGKGFQGVVKRFKFRGQPKSHGTKDQLRTPGSIGATGPEKVFKGKKMPGRMGNRRVTIRNLEIVEVDPEKNLLIVKGAVPGARFNLLEIRS